MIVPKNHLMNFYLILFLTCHYEKNDSKTRKITQFCQLNLLTIDYPTKMEK